ncbi:hypothetical protein R1flu_010422 [Riccia fluitans]|uniref:Purple acid phosphatase n=1 Tax=Riccia fluitans TaxID=41844 RepID=A0ABD1Z539_9MARC
MPMLHRLVKRRGGRRGPNRVAPPIPDSRNVAYSNRPSQYMRRNRSRHSDSAHQATSALSSSIIHPMIYMYASVWILAIAWIRHCSEGHRKGGGGARIEQDDRVCFSFRSRGKVTSNQDNGGHSSVPYIHNDNYNHKGEFRQGCSCDWEIPLVNMRSPYQFRVFKGKAVNVTADTTVDEDGDALPVPEDLLAVSSEVGFHNYNEPTQIHLALTSSPGEMRVMFVTRDSATSFVKYGHKQEHLHSISETRMESYSQSDMCDAPANASIGWRSPGTIHDVVMKDLDQGRRYYYQVGSDLGGWSDIYSFRVPEEDADETHALLYGDMGTTAPYRTFKRLQPESERTIGLMELELKRLENKAVYVSHIGDLSYARGYAWLWDEFFQRIQPLSAQAPYHVCIGNHEYDWPLQPWKPDWASRIYGKDGGGECGVPYSIRFHMPGNSSLSNASTRIATRNLYYSHNVGVVHFLYFSTETDFTAGSEQLAFMEKDLQSVDRKKTPFVLVLGHRPMYSSNMDDQSQPLRMEMIEHIEPLLVKYSVNLVLWGHVHKYERICAIQNHTCDETGKLPVHVVIGMGGQDYQPPWQTRPQHPNTYVYPQEGWSMYRSSEFGYMRLHATRSALKMKYIGNHDGKVHDIVEIKMKEEDDDNCEYPAWFWGLTVAASVVLSLLGPGFIMFVRTGILRRYWQHGDGVKPRSSYLRVQTSIV